MRFGDVWAFLIVAAVAAFIVWRATRTEPLKDALVILRIKDGTAAIEKGSLPARARTFVDDVLRETPIWNGYIALLPQRRVVFSKSIPDEIRQPLRNILLN